MRKDRREEIEATIKDLHPRDREQTRETATRLGFMDDVIIEDENGDRMIVSRNSKYAKTTKP